MSYWSAMGGGGQDSKWISTADSRTIVFLLICNEGGNSVVYLNVSNHYYQHIMFRKTSRMGKGYVAVAKYMWTKLVTMYWSKFLEKYVSIWCKTLFFKDKTSTWYGTACHSWDTATENAQPLATAYLKETSSGTQVPRAAEFFSSLHIKNFPSHSAQRVRRRICHTAGIILLVCPWNIHRVGEKSLHTFPVPRPPPRIPCNSKALPSGLLYHLSS